MGIANKIVGLSYGQEKDQSSVKRHPLGSQGVLPDGRWFRYAKAGEVLGAGQVTMQTTGTAAHDMDLVITAAAVGVTTVTVTLGATLATASQYADGYLYTNDGGGEGHLYKIKSHPAAAASATLALKFYDDDQVVEAIGSTPLGGLCPNPWEGVEVWDYNDIDGPAMGVACREVTTSYYCWLQTHGLSPVLCDMAFVISNHVRMSDAVDGSCEPLNRDGSAEDDCEIGISTLIAPVQSDYGLVFLTFGP